MVHTKEAEAMILATRLDLPVSSWTLSDSWGMILAENLYADRPFPPYHRVCMDGVAISSKAFGEGRRTFKVESTQAAGEAPHTLQNEAHCIEIMTGAVLPDGTDAVIRYEDIALSDGLAEIRLPEVKPWQNVQKMGIERTRDSLLLESPMLIGPAQIAVLATEGQSDVQVKTWPQIAIVSSGDELVEIEEKPLPHQIRKSNVYALKALCHKNRWPTKKYHLADNKKEILQQLRLILESHSIVLMSGGVSKGKFDYLPEALEELGVEKQFHRVAQRPGKPFWFGTYNNGVVFAFPGNPVSTFMCATRYFEPWMWKNAGLEMKVETAILAEDFEFKPSLQYFLQVKLSHLGSHLLATPLKGKGSGDLVNLAQVDAFLELPAERTHFKKNEEFRVWRIGMHSAI
jgi:molybdopterin molybdotransferase